MGSHKKPASLTPTIRQAPARAQRPRPAWRSARKCMETRVRKMCGKSNDPTPESGSVRAQRKPQRMCSWVRSVACGQVFATVTLTALVAVVALVVVAILAALVAVCAHTTRCTHIIRPRSGWALVARRNAHPEGVAAASGQGDLFQLLVSYLPPPMKWAGDSPTLSVDSAHAIILDAELLPHGLRHP